MLGYIKFAAAGIGIAAILALAYSYYSRGEEVKTLTKENSGLTIQNEGLKDTTDTTQKSGAITDQAVSQTTQEKDGSRDAHQGVAEETEREVEQIKRGAAVKKPPVARPPDLKDPLVVPSVPAEADVDAQISAVRIDGLWKAYCLNVPTNPKCAQPAAAK